MRVLKALCVCVCVLQDFSQFGGMGGMGGGPEEDYGDEPDSDDDGGCVRACYVCVVHVHACYTADTRGSRQALPRVCVGVWRAVCLCVCVCELTGVVALQSCRTWRRTRRGRTSRPTTE